jgi:Leu/Phe-tRNA-protein transferase
MTKPETKRRNGSKKKNLDAQERSELEPYIPDYLRRFIIPYHGEFAYTRTYHYRLVAQLMMEGFLPIATEGVILPKLHRERCVITLPQSLHLSKSVRKKSKKFRFTVNRCFDAVVKACQKQHGHRCWLYPELVAVFKQIHEPGHVDTVVIPHPNTNNNNNNDNETRQECPVRLYSIEVWNDETNEMVAGELGYTVGSIYTSLTGFSAQNSAGSVQLLALGRLLSTLGFSLWDLGMDMEYKQSLGSHAMSRDDFVSHVHDVRATKGHLVLPPSSSVFSCKSLIDGEYSIEALLSGQIDVTKSPNPYELVSPNRQTNSHTPPPPGQGGSPEPNRKKRRN